MIKISDDPQMETKTKLPTTRQAAASLMALIERYREVSPRASFRSIEIGADVGIGTLRNLRDIADGSSSSSFTYETLVKLTTWISSAIEAAVHDVEKTTIEATNAR